MIAHLQSGRVQEGVHGECDVCRVGAVVVGHLLQVVVLQGQQQRQQIGRGDFENCEQVPVLQTHSHK